MRTISKDQKVEAIKAVKLCIMKSFFERMSKLLRNKLGEYKELRDEQIINGHFEDLLTKKIVSGVPFSQAREEVEDILSRKLEAIDNICRNIYFNDFAFEIHRDLDDLGIDYKWTHMECEFSLEELTFSVGDHEALEVLRQAYKVES